MAKMLGHLTLWRRCACRDCRGNPAAWRLIDRRGQRRREAVRWRAEYTGSAR